MMRVLISDKIGIAGIDLLKSEGFEAVFLPDITPEDLIKEVASYDALVVRGRTKVTRDVIAAAQKVKVIARSGTGTDNIDKVAAKERGIMVVNAPGANAESVAEHTIALLLALSRDLVNTATTLQSGVWAKADYHGIELQGKVLGVIGFGNIGKRVAQLGKAFGMNIIVHTKTHDEAVDHNLGEVGARFVTLDELIKQSDVITVHTPLTAQTKGLIREDQFASMKKTAFLINTARGAVVDEKALVAALTTGQIAKAALDVYDVEPLSTESPLFTLTNIILTPHVGADSREAEERASLMVAHDIIAVLQGKAPEHLVT